MEPEDYDYIVYLVKELKQSGKGINPLEGGI